MPTNYLPRLDPDKNKLQKLSKHGEWMSEGSRTDIDALADAIEVPELPEGAAKLDKDHIYSIPDPWARVMLFARALVDPAHPAHRKVVGEWRGLLTILALKEIRNFKELAVQTLVLDEEKLRAAKQPKESFLWNAAVIKPGREGLLSSTTSWDQINILSWRSPGGSPRAFAFTSPTTLVATGAYYAEVMNSEEVPWFKDPVFATPPPPREGRPTDKVLVQGGTLQGPSGDQLSDDEKVALAQWLRYVHTKLSEDSLSPAAKIMKLLEKFQQDVVKDLDIELATNEVDVLSSQKIGFGAAPKSIYNFIDRPAKLDTSVLSDLMLVTRDESKKYLLLYPAAADELGMEARKISFYKGVSLATASRHYSDDVKTGTVDDAVNISYCTREFFLSDDLVYVMKAKALPGCRKLTVDAASHSCAQQRETLFPVTETAAALYGSEEIAKRCKIRWESGDEAVVSFDVSVVSIGTDKEGKPLVGKPTTVTLTKTYTRDNLHAIATTMPVIGVWPNVWFDKDEPKLAGTGDNRWGRYYLFESWRGGANTADKLVLRTRPMEDAHAPGRLIKQGAYFKITAMTRFPEVLVCETPSEVEQQNRPDVVEGLLLLEGKRQTVHATENAVLGVDFGTTGTSIYRSFFAGDSRSGKTKEIHPVLLRDRFLQVTASSDAELLNLTRELFIPAKDWSASKILSIYQDLESTEKTEQGKQPRLPVTHGHVLFADEKDSRSFIPEKQKNYVHSNLKWGDRAIVAKAATDFISQLCMQSVLELACLGAKSVEVRYSYPTAFSKSDVYDFGKTWEDVIKHVEAATSIPIEVDIKRDIKQNYEAVAAARYFEEEDGLTAVGGALTLDIGGGTTDLALLNVVGSKATLLRHSSVLFAGRDIFLAPIHEHAELLEVIRNPDRSPDPVPAFMPGAEIETGTSAFRALVDAHIQMYGDRLMADTRARFSKDNPQLAEFLKIIELGLCGIAFYSGLYWGNMIAASASRNGAVHSETENVRNQMDELITASTIRVYIGGNGSKLLKWCGRGSFDDRAPIYAAFADCLQAGVSVAAPGLPKKEVKIKPSEHPKEEVAYGLVVNGWEKDASKDFTLPLAGESFVLNGVQKTWNDPLEMSSLRAGTIQVGDQKQMQEGGEARTAGRLPVFSAFLEAAGERLDPFELETIWLSVNSFLGELREDLLKTPEKSGGENEVRNKVRNEPVFFLALKYLIQKKIDTLKKPKD